MNILYFTFYEVAPSKGGTERTTTTIATGLRQSGHKVYSAYAQAIPSALQRAEFDGTFHISHKNTGQIAAIIKRHDIDVVINQGDFYENPYIKRAIEATGSKCKLVFVHHFAPADEIRSFTRTALRSKIRPSLGGLKSLVNYTFFKSYSKRIFRQHKILYKAVLNDSDRVVLLSKTYENEFREFAECDSGRMEFIPNALSFDTFASDADIDNKEPIVVVVARLDELHKRISATLQAWKIIESQPALSKWRLIIAGDGPDRQMYEDYCKANLQRVEFPGRVNPEKYYLKSSIFAMTSPREGWGLTLTESQQCGCVPIAMNSFASLSDIVTNNHDGIIIPDGDIPALAEAMKNLMSDTNLRHSIAINAIQSTKRYAKSNVIAQWQALLASL